MRFRVSWKIQLSYLDSIIPSTFSTLRKSEGSTSCTPVCCSATYWLTKVVKLFILNYRASADEILVAHMSQGAASNEPMHTHVWCSATYWQAQNGESGHLSCEQISISSFRVTKTQGSLRLRWHIDFEKHCIFPCRVSLEITLFHFPDLC